MHSSTPPLGDMSTSDFRRYGYEVVDWIANYFDRLEEFPVLSQNEPNQLKNSLPKSAPETGEPFDDILEDVEKNILPAVAHWNHPHFHGLFGTSASAVGIFGEMLSATFDMKAMLWRTGPASTELEQVVLDWLRQMMGLPDTFSGLIYDTASISSLHAIACAREKMNLGIREEGMSGRSDLRLFRVYCSDQVHSSIDKACILLGLGMKSLVKIPHTADFQMDIEKLSQAIQEDISKGFLPFCVVAVVGTTSTGSVDPVPQIAEICKRNNLWLHVDAAYAGSASIVPELQICLKGVELADSLVTNPHKWLFTPFDISVLYVKDMPLLKQTFSLIREYLKTSDSGVENQMDYGIQLGRRFRSLKLWFVLRYFGKQGLIDRIRDHCRLAKLIASWIEKSSDWELTVPVNFALVCFRACPHNLKLLEQELNTLNEKLMNNINSSGKAYISHTKLLGKYILRLSVGSIHVEEKHIEAVWSLLNEYLGKEVSKILKFENT